MHRQILFQFSLVLVKLKLLLCYSEIMKIIILYFLLPDPFTLNDLTEDYNYILEALNVLLLLVVISVAAFVVSR